MNEIQFYYNGFHGSINIAKKITLDLIKSFNGWTIRGVVWVDYPIAIKDDSNFTDTIDKTLSEYLSIERPVIRHTINYGSNAFELLPKGCLKLIELFPEENKNQEVKQSTQSTITISIPNKTVIYDVLMNSDEFEYLNDLIQSGEDKYYILSKDTYPNSDEYDL